MHDVTCAGCNRTFDPGDRYIEDTASGFLGTTNDELDYLAARIFGGDDGKLRYCENCTQDGGIYSFKIYEITDA